MNLSDARREDCLGFAIQREDRTEDERFWMEGMKTFEATDPGLGPGGKVSSRFHPFQGFQWADYAAKPGHRYTYSVHALTGTPEKPKLGPRTAVDIETEAEVGGTHSVFFNRGAVASQEYTRRFQNKAPDQLSGPNREAAYRWLSRGLLEAQVGFIERAAGPDFEIHGAVYEFQWPDVLAALRAAKARGVRVRVVYDDIPKISKKTGKDTNSTRRKNNAAIEAAKIRGLTIRRTEGDLMHNKFFVLSQNGKPKAVWTGSTNLTENGLFGHLNVGHIVDDSSVAATYLEYWKRLAGDPTIDDQKTWLGEHNPAPPSPWDRDLTTVFSPHRGKGVLDWYAEIAGSAEEALFMTFAFGMEERFKNVYRRDDGLLRMALMEQEGSGSNLKKQVPIIREIAARPNVLIAIGHRVKASSFDRWLMDRWLEERPGMTNNVEWVHTKFMLVDPLSDSPTIVTGSANFSEGSTDENDENMLVIRGDTRAADIYLGEYLRCYSHHAFRQALARSDDDADAWRPQYLVDDDSWQEHYFKPGHDRDLRRRYFARADD